MTKKKEQSILKDIKLIIVFPTGATKTELEKFFKDLKKSTTQYNKEVLAVAGVKILYRKDEWECIEC